VEQPVIQGVRSVLLCARQNHQWQTTSWRFLQRHTHATGDEPESLATATHTPHSVTLRSFFPFSVLPAYLRHLTQLIQRHRRHPVPVPIVSSLEVPHLSSTIAWTSACVLLLASGFQLPASTVLWTSPPARISERKPGCVFVCPSVRLVLLVLWSRCCLPPLPCLPVPPSGSIHAILAILDGRPITTYNRPAQYEPVVTSKSAQISIDAGPVCQSRLLVYNIHNASLIRLTNWIY
jgi:hypothetical protein